MTVSPCSLSDIDPDPDDTDKPGQALYDERRWGDMPILGDALLDAGCDVEEAVAHCRVGGEHVRGCWVIDLCLGKE